MSATKGSVGSKPPIRLTSEPSGFRKRISGKPSTLNAWATAACCSPLMWQKTKYLFSALNSGVLKTSCFSFWHHVHQSA